MIQLIYVSVAREPFSESELVSLLETSRRNNVACGVTGMLLHEDGTFLQILEGPEEVVQRLYDRIRLDRRHDGHLVLWRKEVEEPTFDGWSMGFANVRTDDLHRMPGYCDFFHPSYYLTGGKEEGSKAYTVLSRFRDGAYRRNTR